MADLLGTCLLHDPPQDIDACPCPMGDRGSDYYRPKLVAALADLARLRALGLEACDIAASYADDSREYGAPSPRIDEIRKELTR